MLIILISRRQEIIQ